jgi:hypothetical protein
MALLAEIESAHLLPLEVFALRAHQSAHEIAHEIAAGRLLALSDPSGSSRPRLPAWQLDPVRLRLVQDILASGLDAWTAYQLLTRPLASLAHQSPVEAVNHDNVGAILAAAINAVGIH